jgi:membrane-associated phospholipid phosphatase
VHVWPRNRRLGLVLAAWTALVWLSVVYLGEHYVADVLGGVAYACAGLLLVRRWRRVMRGPGLREPAHFPRDDARLVA